MKKMKRWMLLLIVVFSPVLMGAQDCYNPVAPAADNPVAFCSRAGSMFYCNANGGPQTLQAQGWSGYCMAAGNNGSYTTGYSGYASGNAATPAYSRTSEAWANCGSQGVTDRGWCLGVITCTRQ